VRVLVTGPTGFIGGRVLAELVGQGVPTRLLVRDPSRLPATPAGTEVFTGDFRDGASVRSALTGVTAALYVSPHDPAEEEWAETFCTWAPRMRCSAG
jgi:uncharacterized protein YbjT (DUF2867 family)